MTAFITNDDLALARNRWIGADISREQLLTAQSSAAALVLARAFSGKLRDLGVEKPAIEQLRDVALAYEITASGAVSALADGVELRAGSMDERKAMQASAFFAYDLMRAVPSQTEGDAKYIEALTLCALGYLGDRGVDLHTVLARAPEPPINQSWDRGMFFALYDCWRTLFDPGVGGYQSVTERIGSLRAMQPEREPSFLQVEEHERPERAFRLLALYNLARGTELLAAYLRGGSSEAGGGDIDILLDRYFQDARSAALRNGDRIFELLTWWLHAAAKRMTELSVWRYERGSLATLVRRLANQAEPLYQLLPPQREALLHAGILDAARTAIVIDMPTSSGKTLLAEFRIAQTLAANQSTGGWVAYVVPTRALASQIVRGLRKHLGDEFRIEALSAAVDVDALEQDMLASDNPFDVLVCTPEKLSSLLRSKRVTRPLALAVIDEAQGISDKTRGVSLELLLARLRSETQAEFMLMMPYVPNAEELATWLSNAGAGGHVSLSSTPWKPNDVLIGTYSLTDDSRGRDWGLEFSPLLASRSLSVDKTLPLEGRTPIDETASSVRNTNFLAATAMAVSFDDVSRGTNLVMCPRIETTWKVGYELKKALRALPASADRDLVARFIETEVSAEFALANLVRHGIGVHHAGLPDDVKALMEWLTEHHELRALCATSTIAQGMNFNVASVFLTTLNVYDPRTRSTPMQPRDFWNLAGRTGRIGQSSVGVVGLYAGSDSANEAVLRDMIAKEAQALDTHLERLLKALDIANPQNAMTALRFSVDWADFRSYVAHMIATVDRVTTHNVDQLVRATLGYRRLNASAEPLDRAKAQALISMTRQYVSELSQRKDIAVAADGTGFSPDAIRKLMDDFQRQPIAARGWAASSMFSGADTSILPRLVGAMMNVPQIAQALTEIGGDGYSHKQIASIAIDWVNGASLESIARKYFLANTEAGDLTNAISVTCRAIFKNLAYAAPWGVSSLMQIRGSGIDFDALSDEEKRELELLPAYIYHGVRTVDAVAMRINLVPRSIAENLGERFRSTAGATTGSKVAAARSFLNDLSDAEWHAARPLAARISGAEYKALWKRLSS